MLLLSLLVGCTGEESSPTRWVRDPLWVVPNSIWIDEDDTLLIPREIMPTSSGTTPFPVERLRWRTGFSSVQTVVFSLSERVDASTLPSQEQADEAGSVQIWDLDDGRRIPCMAELDAYPQDEELPSLIVRPLQPIPVGHRVSIVVTEDVRTESGDAIALPDWARAALDGHDVEGMSASAYRSDMERLETLGLSGIRFLTSFPVSDGSRPLRRMVEEVEIPSEWTLEDPLYSEDTTLLPPGIAARIEGSFSVDNWLVDDGAFELDSDGMPIRQEREDADLYIYVSETAASSEPGTAPVWIFGHGIFSEPDNYLFRGSDVSGVADIADRAGAIIVSTRWRGLTYTDMPTAVTVGNDFGRIPELTDKLAQGVANTVALSRLIVEGELFDAPVFGGVADTSQVFYYGISLGGIQGAVFLALDSNVEHGVLHVGGSSWSTMLERSSHWSTFEVLVRSAFPSATDRQHLYALSQLFWDVSDPASFVNELETRSVLWQEAIGDEQVANLSTELLMRGIGAPVLSPAANVPPLVEEASSPTVGPVLVQFDPEVSVPAAENRPAEITGAHDLPRHWEGQHAQVLRFLDPEDPGVVEHFCGETVCSASNTGSSE